MNLYLQDLLQRMSDSSYRPGCKEIEGLFESHKTISWQAYEEVRELKDPTLLPYLYNFIESSPSEDERRYAYFITGFIVKNCHDEKATAFLLERLKKEKKTAIIILLLDRLAELYKPETFDLSIIYKLIETKGALIRKAAYSALTNTGHSVERFLLDKLTATNCVDDITAIIYALGYVGGERSVAAIKPFLKNRKLDIKFAAQNYLPAIMVRTGYPVTDICRVTGVSTNFVNERQARILEFTRPG